nr:MAG TPA: hypothetical protein [Caudoviricetes sp.]
MIYKGKRKNGGRNVCKIKSELKWMKMSGFWHLFLHKMSGV